MKPKEKFVLNYWEPYCGCPLILRQWTFTSYVKLLQQAKRFAKKQGLDKWQRVRQLDVTLPDGHVYHFKHREFT